MEAIGAILVPLFATATVQVRHKTCKHCLTMFNVQNGEHNIWKSFPQNIHTFKNLLRPNYEQTFIQAWNVRYCLIDSTRLN